MARPPSSCPRCQGSMEEGFVVDESYGRRLPAKWIEGAPQYWMWNVVIRGKRQREVATYRCRNCGFLESYASE